MGDVCLPFDVIFLCAGNANNFCMKIEVRNLIEIFGKISGGCLGETRFNCRMRGGSLEEVAHFLPKYGMVSCWIKY